MAQKFQIKSNRFLFYFSIANTLLFVRVMYIIYCYKPCLEFQILCSFPDFGIFESISYFIK